MESPKINKPFQNFAEKLLLDDPDMELWFFVDQILLDLWQQFKLVQIDFSIDDVELRFETGLDAINIAPEFGQIESEYYLEECKKDKQLFEELYQICYNSGKWKKWVKDIERISKSELIMTCCHYVLSEEGFLEKIKSQFPNADQLIKKRISSKLKLLNEQTKNYCI
jgi:hypothetical protein